MRLNPSALSVGDFVLWFAYVALSVDLSPVNKIRTPVATYLALRGTLENIATMPFQECWMRFFVIALRKNRPAVRAKHLHR